LKHCKALICLSAYMAEDLKLIYPQIPIFNIKHPIANFSEKFVLEHFLSDPKVVLVGYWLRRHHRFYKWQAPIQKIHLLKKYTPDHMSWEMKAFGTLRPEEEASVTKYNFLPAVDYDRLLRSSLVYLSLYETSGNNSVIECISMGTPFIADRHPAIEEYVGQDYPLLLEPGELERMSREELIHRASEAHGYLASHPSLAEDLNYQNFKENLYRIIETL
jgi:glycosyltransferase involved in cell wall biosynthesis